MKNFMKEFQAFISKGNVMDLAVAVIIGAAFSAIVSSMVKDIINPLVGFIVGRPDFTELFLVLKMPVDYTGPMTYAALTKAGATVLGYGSFLTAVVQFVMLAFVIFWLVKIVKNVRTKFEKEEAAAPAKPAPTPEDIVLLREIRDLLNKEAK